MRSLKKLSLIILFILCMFPLSITSIQGNESGSIEITLNESTDDESFGLVKIAEIVSGEYKLIEPFDQSDIAINKIDNADDSSNAAKTLINYVKEADEIKTSIDHKIIFDALSLGVYLVYPISIPADIIVDPFIVSIPTWDNDQLLYDVKVVPKQTDNYLLKLNKQDVTTKQNILGSNFEFTSYSDQALDVKLNTIKGDIKNGTATFSLNEGTIYIKETKAPNGYKLSDEVIKVELNDEGLFINDIKQISDNHIYSYSYLNKQNNEINTSVHDHDASFYIILCSVSLVFLIMIYKIITKLKTNN